MSLHCSNEADEWRECDFCFGDGQDRFYSEGMSGERCSLCTGTGRIPNPDARPDIEVRRSMWGAGGTDVNGEHVPPERGWGWRRIDGPLYLNGPYLTFDTALAAARKEILR